MSSLNEAVRLDKWLWAARFYKTRAIAKNAIEGGKVHYEGQRSKVSKIVEKPVIIWWMHGLNCPSQMANIGCVSMARI